MKSSNKFAMVPAIVAALLALCAPTAQAGTQTPYTAWVTDTDYLENSVVLDGGNLYICVDSDNCDDVAEPDTDSGTYWNLYEALTSLTLDAGGSEDQFPGTTGDLAGINAALSFIKNAKAGPGAPVEINVADGSYNYAGNTISIDCPHISSLSLVGGTAVDTVPAPAVYPTLSATGSGSSLTAGNVYVGFTYSLSYSGGETLMGPVSEIDVASGNTITASGWADNSGISDVNIYASASANSTTLYKVGSYSPSSSSETISAYPTTGSAPSGNPTEPVTLEFSDNDDSSYTAFITDSTPNSTVNGFYIDGTDSGSNEGYDEGFVVSNAENVTLGPNVLVGNFGSMANSVGRCQNVCHDKQRLILSDPWSYASLARVECRIGHRR